MMETVAAKRIAGIQERCSNEHPEWIGALWAKFRLEHAAVVNGQEIFAVYFNYDGDHTQPYTLLLGTEVPANAPLPDNLDAVTIAAGRYKRFDASGEQPQSIIAAWQKIWQSDLPRSYGTDFEAYGEDGKVTIYIGCS